MKKTLIYLTIFFISFFVFDVVLAEEEVIDDFMVTIDVEKNSDLLVTEEISYDFSTNEKHGIFRDIPFRYKTATGKITIGIGRIAVFDEFKNEYNFSVEKKGDYKRIKIGDPNEYVSGKKKYIIKYRVDGAINFFEDHDELYWNVTGDEWPVTIKQSRAVVNLPEAINEDELKKQCFKGMFGSTLPCISHRFEYENKDLVKSVSFVNDRLKSGEDFTVVVGVPKNIIKEPGLLLKIFRIIKDNFIIALPFLTFFLMFYLWYKKGKDPLGRGVIITQFDAPKNLSPSEVGTIVDERTANHDISADIVNLAIKGYIKITKLKKDGLIVKSTDFSLKKLKEADKTLQKHETMILSGLFEKDKTEVKLSELKNDFYKDLAKIKKAVYRSTVKKGYFNQNPTKVRSFYTIVGVILMVLAWFSGPLFDFFGILAFALSGLLVIIFGVFMPKKTRKGVLAREHILGLKKYISVAEIDRINFHSAPEKSPEYFEKLLPFAMALKVEKDWAKQFEGIYNQEPKWYSDTSRSYFSALALNQGLKDFSSKANTVLYSAPSSASSGGSGFSGGGSGGGFGGGGGGSW